MVSRSESPRVPSRPHGALWRRLAFVRRAGPARYEARGRLFFGLAVFVVIRRLFVYANIYVFMCVGVSWGPV